MSGTSPETMPARPPEPDIKALNEYGANYESGLQDYFEIDETLDEDVVGKRAVIDYLWDHWNIDASHQDLSEACGDASFRIDQWLEGEKTWDDVLDRIEQELP